MSHRLSILVISPKYPWKHFYELYIIFSNFRMMRAHTNNDWQQSYPKTNIFWLHYLLDKTINNVIYKNKKSKRHRSSLLNLKKLKERILDFDSCYDFACWCENEFIASWPWWTNYNIIGNIHYQMVDIN